MSGSSPVCCARLNRWRRIPGLTAAGKLQGSDDAYRIRVGDYRVIYTVDDTVLIVAVERVRHRREVYR